MNAARKEEGRGEGRRGKDCSWAAVQIIYEPYSVLHCEYLPTGVRDTMCRAGAGAGSKGTGEHGAPIYYKSRSLFFLWREWST